MSHSKAQKVSLVSARLLAIPMFTKIAIAVQTAYSKITGNMATNPLTIIPQTEIGQQLSCRHDAIISLLNQGKNYHEAEAIVNMSADWDLDLSFLEAAELDVRGNSVWINLEG